MDGQSHGWTASVGGCAMGDSCGMAASSGCVVYSELLATLVVGACFQ